MRRVVVVVVAVLGGFAASACTTFDFAAPSGATASEAGATDATTEAQASLDASPDAGGPALLDLTTAARLCALVFACPGLGQAIESSLVIPVMTPATPLNFSGCMDWLAGPVDPARIGLAEQRKILQAIAAPSDASSCAAAYASSPIHPVDAGATCAATSCDGTQLETCSSAGAFTASCGAPLFDQAGTCVVTPLSSVALCETPGACTPGGSCSGASTYVDCYKEGASYTAYDCALSGRTCVDKGAPDCVTPGKLAAPCPDRAARDACDSVAGASYVLHCAGGFLAETEFDCTATGASCSTTSGVARCVAPGATCTPFQTDGLINACSGAAISVCIGGQPTSFDCGMIGLSCVPESGTQTAHCG